MSIPKDFDWQYYVNNYKDLQKAGINTYEKAIKHYITYGHKEKRVYSEKPHDIHDNIPSIPLFFNNNVYNENYGKNMSSIENYNYWLNYGKNQGEIIINKYLYLKKLYILYYYGSNNLEINYTHITKEILDEFRLTVLLGFNLKFAELEPYIMLQRYFKENHETEISFDDAYKRVITDHKLHFRYICYRYINYIKNFDINIQKYNTGEIHNETVLIEFRPFNNLEFIIRNMCLKLPTWKHTVICGNLNKDLVKKICNKISPHLNVIVYNKDCLNIDEYSKLLTAKSFWKLLTGVNILIHQDDSLIFDPSTINKWLTYDYVGAPWPQDIYPNGYHVGNGGFSLRKRLTMYYICSTFDINKFEPFEFTKKYMLENNLKIPPEDCFFVYHIVKFGLGYIPSFDEALHFSSESFKTLDSLGGHCFWLSDNNWLNRVLKMIKQFYCYGIHYISHYCHRFGWNNLLVMLYVNDIITPYKTDIQLIDICEKHFGWDRLTMDDTQKWIGMVHLTPTSPEGAENINTILKNSTFVENFKNCKNILTFTNYLKLYIENTFKFNNLNSLHHPIYINIKDKFSITDYINNNDKKIIQIGQQLRILKTFYLLKFSNHTKLWLTGISNANDNKQLLNRAKSELNIENITDYNVNTLFVDNTIYDNLLKNNVLFMHVYDSSANNAILEAIVYETPIVCNRHPAIEEYLGKDYPLFFDNIVDVNDEFISDKRIELTNDYLKNLNKDIFSYKTFNNNLLKYL